MADANIDLRGKNLFGLGANFKTKSGDTNVASNTARAFGNTGKSIQSARFGDTTTYQQVANYCGSDLSTDLGTLATDFGDVVDDGDDDIVLTALSINYSASGYPQITFSGHNHGSNAHTSMTNTKDISAAIPAAGFGVPDFDVTTGTDASPISAGLTFNIEHFDVDDADGTHLHGANTEKVTYNLNVDYSGIPTSDTQTALETDLSGVTGFDILVPSTDRNETNADFQSFSFTAEGMGT